MPGAWARSHEVDLPPRSRPQLHHRPLRNDIRAIEHPLHTCTAYSLKMVKLQILREMCAILMLATVRPELCGNSDAA